LEKLCALPEKVKDQGHEVNTSYSDKCTGVANELQT